MLDGFSERSHKRLQVAKVKEVTILRDQLTGSSRGCAFAIFEEKADADLAIDKLDKKFTLPGSGQPIEASWHLLRY